MGCGALTSGGDCEAGETQVGPCRLAHINAIEPGGEHTEVGASYRFPNGPTIFQRFYVDEADAPAFAQALRDAPMTECSHTPQGSCPPIDMVTLPPAAANLQN